MIKKFKEFESTHYIQSDVATVFNDSRELLDWVDELKDNPNSEVGQKLNKLSPLYFKNIKRQLMRLYNDGEIDTIQDAENIILNESFHSSYDKYLKDKEFMKYFNKVKNRILELFPNHNMSNIELLIDKIYTCYTLKYSIEDTVNKLYRSADLYKFTTAGLDQ